MVDQSKSNHHAFLKTKILNVALSFILALVLLPVVHPEEAIALESSWLWPVPSSTTINQRWNSTHGGLDIGGAYGCDIVASKSGTVYIVLQDGVSYKNHIGYGNGVVINHGDGTYSHYAHMASTCVSNGQIVSQGQKNWHNGCNRKCHGYASSLRTEIGISGTLWRREWVF